MSKFSAQHLRRFHPFGELSDEYLQQLFEKLELKQAAKGTILFRRGVETTHTTYLLKGLVELVNSKFEAEAVKSGTERGFQPMSETSITGVSAVAKEPIIYCQIERDFVDLVLAWSESGGKDAAAESGGSEDLDDEGDWMSNLLESPLFTQVPPANIQQLFVKFETREVKAGDVVVKQGEPGDYFYVIARGRAVVQLPHGEEVPLEAGRYFGEEALIADTPRNATVAMSTNGQLMRLGKEDFKSLLQEPVINYISQEDLTALKGKGYNLLDVRMPIERKMGGKVPESLGVPLQKLRDRLAELDTGLTCVVTDDGGRRSEVAAHLLSQAGFGTVILKDSATLYG
ncbi:MAG: cyclic nucleotide-binding domain-containing protein [Cellvibrionaceae bacterium]